MSLKLDFSLETVADRLEFINNYPMPEHLTAHEKEVMADYILWSKDIQSDNIQLDSKWSNQTHIESLDELLETPTFDENSIRPTSAPRYKITREVFSRSQTRKQAPAYVLPDFEALWRNIDSTDLMVEEYELFHKLRTAPVRETLLARFSPDEYEHIVTQSHTISQYTYLRKKRQLVDLRREQYTMRDTYSEPLFTQSTSYYQESNALEFGNEIAVKPFGLTSQHPIDAKLFAKGHIPLPQDFSEEDLALVSARIWAPAQDSAHIFDFTNPDHLYKLYCLYDTFEDAADRERSMVNSTLPNFWDTLTYYRSIADLTPILNDILDLKAARKANQQIADYVNAKYHKSYGANYISTLFCKKALAAIAEAAAYHYDVIQNLFFEENFKTCIDCGKTLLIDPRNFVRKAKSKDGFSPRCKQCEKLKRASSTQYTIIGD